MKRRCNLKRCLSLTLSLGLIVACGESSSTGDEVSVAEVTPSDSSGVHGDVGLTFASDTSDTTRLGLAIDLGGGIEITEAKFNLAAVKIKAVKEQSSGELELEKKEKDEEKEELKEVERLADVTSLVMGGKDSKGDDRRKKLAKEKTKLADKETKALNKHKQRDKSLKFAGPFVYDAILGTLDSKTETASLPDGSYRRLEFKLRRNWSVDESDPLFGNVFYIDGTFTQGEKTTRFLIDHHAAINFRLRGDGAVGVDPKLSNSLAVVFDLSKWFEGVDLTQASVDADSSIMYINHTSNEGILKIIRQNIKKHIKFGKDKNADGTLSEEETAGEGEAETGDDHRE